MFYISLNKGYFGKAIFSRLFSARYHNLKKKKKKRYWAYVDVVLIITLSILATCLVSSNCSVTHVRWGEGTSSVLFQWRPAFSALWRCGNSVVSVHHINNFWNTRSNLTTFSGQSPQWLRMVCAKLHVKRFQNWLRYQRKTIRRRCHNVGSVLCINTLPYQVWPTDYQSDLDNRCVWSGYENEGCEQHEYSLWRHRFTNGSVEVTLRSDCLGRLNQLSIGQGGGGRRGVLNS